MNASTKRDSVAKMMKAWESKNARRALQGAGLSTMAVTLAACGGSSTTTTTTTPTTPVTPVDTTPAAQAFTLTSAVNAFTGAGGADTFTAATAAVLQSFDVLDGGDGIDTLTITDVVDAFEGATGVGGTISNIENLVVNSSGGFGTVAADASGAVVAAAGAEQVLKLTVSAPTDGTAVTVTINGVTYATSITNASGNTATEAADAIEAVVDAVLGGNYFDNTLGAVTITSPYEGSALPTITASNTVVATSGNVANADTVLATGAVAQVLQWTLGGTGHAESTVTLHVDGINIGSFAADTTVGASKREAAATKIATELNKHLEGATATATGSTITVTADVAGVNAPFIGVAVTGATATTFTQTEVVAGAKGAVAASGAVSEVVFDASGFSDAVTLTAADDIVVKAAATADVTIASSAGSVDVDGGATVNITATGAVVVMGDKITSAVVETGTGTGDTVIIGATSGTVADTPLLESASVTGGTTITVIDEKNGTSSGTLTKVDLAGIAGTATLTGKALTEVNLGAQTTSQTINVVNAATTDHVLSLSVADTGIDADGAAQQVTIVDDTAKTVALTVNGTDNDILIDGDASLTTLTVTGAGAAGIALHSTTAVTSIDASAATGDIDLTGVEAVAVTIKTGAGDDTFTTAATAAMTATSGAGNDTVTLGATVAKGSTVDLGAGNDTLLNSSGGVATDDAATVTNAKITTIDGGDGTDTLAASLITAGNADQFANFEVLGLDKAFGSLDAALVSGITSLDLLAGGGTYTNVTQAQSLQVAATGMSGTTTLTLSDVTGAADSCTITFAEQNVAERTADPASANVAAGTIVTAGVETIAIVSGGTFTWNSITLGGNTDAETVTITGAQNLDLAFASGFGSVSSPATGVAMIDGSSATGDLAITMTNVVENATLLEVKTGSGDDTVTTGTQVVTITTGTGADTIDVGANTPTMTGTATAAEAVAELVTITDFTTDDTIDFTAATIALASAAVVEVDVSAATTLFGAIGIATTGNGNTNTNSAVAHFEYNGDTYLLFDEATETSSDMDTGDVLVKLLGTGYDFDNATLTTGGVFTL